VQTEYSYEPFGKAMSIGGANSNSLQYTGRENDETALYYYRARYYNPELHRFLGEDPLFEPNHGVPHLLHFFLWQPLLLNLYNYTGDNPMNFTDPSGLQPYRGQYPPGRIPWDTQYGPKVRDAYGDARGGPFDNSLDGVSSAAGNNPLSNCIRGCLLSAWDRCNKQYVPDFYTAHFLCGVLCRKLDSRRHLENAAV
jgi:RHS repeat-associated protein